MEVTCFLSECYADLLRFYPTATETRDTAACPEGSERFSWEDFGVRAVDNLKTILAPVLPHTARRLHEYLGYEGRLFGSRHVVQ